MDWMQNEEFKRCVSVDRVDGIEISVQLGGMGGGEEVRLGLDGCGQGVEENCS